MINMKRGVLFAFCLIVFSGCETTSQWPQFSGFLGDYKGMYRSNDIEGIFIIKHDVKNVSDYTKFLVDPVAVRLTPDAKAYLMPEIEIERIARQFRIDVINALNANNTVVEDSAAGVIRIRLAITDVLSDKKEGSSIGLVEAEFLDSNTQERIAAVLTSSKGMHLDEWAQLLKDRLVYIKSETKNFQIK